MRFLTPLFFSLPVFSAVVRAESSLPLAESAQPSTRFAQPSERGEEGEASRGSAADVAVAHRQARVVSLFRALEQTLAPVTDKASADAAAPAILRLTCDLRQIREESHRTCEKEEEKAMDNWCHQYGKAFTQLTEKAFGKALDLLLDAPSCHGSSALEGALFQLFDVLEERAPEDSPST